MVRMEVDLDDYTIKVLKALILDNQLNSMDEAIEFLAHDAAYDVLNLEINPDILKEINNREGQSFVEWTPEYIKQLIQESDTVHMNVNDELTVKLTSRGEEVLQDFNYVYNKMDKESKIVKLKLAELMSIFGKYDLVSENFFKDIMFYDAKIHVVGCHNNSGECRKCIDCQMDFNIDDCADFMKNNKMELLRGYQEEFDKLQEVRKAENRDCA